MAKEVFADDPTVTGGSWSTLASGYTSGATSLTITSNSKYASADPTATPPTQFWVRIDNEMFLVTDNRTTTWTVAGAQEGSSAANHSSGATVTQLLGKTVYQSFQTLNSLLPNVFTPEQYGAKGDKRCAADGAITSAQATLSSTTLAFTSADVGKKVRVNGAGASGAHLVTTINSVSGGVATLATNAGTTVSSAVVTVGTDDTTAWQSAINAAQAVSGVVQALSTSGYVCAGALQSTSTYNSVLKIPQTASTSTSDATPGASLTILGPDSSASGNYYLAGAARAPLGCFVEFLTVASGSSPSGLSAGTPGDGYGMSTFNWTHLTIRGIGFRTAPDQGLIAVNLGPLNSCSLERVGIDKNVGSNFAAAPTNASDVGIRLPNNNNGASVFANDTWIDGYTIGAIACEHAAGANLNFMHCGIAIQFTSGSHAANFGRIGVQNCVKGLQWTGALAVNIAQLDVEHASSGIWVTTYDIDDASNLGQGEISLAQVKAGSGATYELKTNGGTNLAIRLIGYPARAYDTTTRSNGSIGTATSGSAWTVDGGTWNIASNKITLTDTGGTDYTVGFPLRYSGNTVHQATLAWGTKAEAGFKLSSKVNGDYLIVAVRTATGDIAVTKKIGGSFTSVGTKTTTISTGMKLRVERKGHRLIVSTDTGSGMAEVYNVLLPIPELVHGHNQGLYAWGSNCDAVTWTDYTVSSAA